MCYWCIESFVGEDIKDIERMLDLAFERLEDIERATKDDAYENINWYTRGIEKYKLQIGCLIYMKLKTLSKGSEMKIKTSENFSDVGINFQK